MHHARFEEALNEYGLVEATAAQIKAAIELGHHLAPATPEERPVSNSPAEAAALVLFEKSGLEQEHLRVFLQDTRNHVLDIVKLYPGSANPSQGHVGELFKPAIRRTASAIIAVHNHRAQRRTLR